MLTIPSRVIAACFALVGFAAAAIVGAVAGNPMATVLWRGLIVMGACWLIGRLVGLVMTRAVQEHIDTYKRSHPIPDDPGSSDGSDAEAVAAEFGQEAQERSGEQVMSSS